VRWGFSTRVVSCGLASNLYRFTIVTVVERVPNPTREPSPYLLCAHTVRCVLGAWVCRQCAYTVTGRGCSVRRHGPVSLLPLRASSVRHIPDAWVRGSCAFMITVRGRGARLHGPSSLSPSRPMLFLRRIRPHIRSFPDCVQATFGFGRGRVIGSLLTSSPSQPEQCRDVYFGPKGCGIVSPFPPPRALFPASPLPAFPKAPGT
jgi:hypothetical protein